MKLTHSTKYWMMWVPTHVCWYDYEDGVDDDYDYEYDCGDDYIRIIPEPHHPKKTQTQAWVSMHTNIHLKCPILSIP